MDAKTLLNQLSDEDICALLLGLGSEPPIPDASGNAYFTTVCHHGNSSKLMYYKDTKQFYCYTSCGSLSLFDVVAGALKVDFKTAFQYVCQFKGISPHAHGHLGFGTTETVNEDFSFLTVLEPPQSTRAKDLTVYHPGILKLFEDAYPKSWAEEGIVEAVAMKFDLKYCFHRQAVIIPYRNPQGALVGVRQRNFNPQEVEAGRKYIPLQAEGTCYRYPSSQVLFGYYENQATIQRYKRVILFEAEKSVMLMSSYFGIDKDYSVALGGMNLSLTQRQLLLDLGVETVILALDKENTNDLNSKETKQYLRKLKKIVSLLIPYVQVEIVFCWDERVDYKASPIDHGKATFEALLNERQTILDLSVFDDVLNQN